MNVIRPDRSLFTLLTEISRLFETEMEICFRQSKVTQRLTCGRHIGSLCNEAALQLLKHQTSRAF
jgi:hypothetical protein